MYDKTVRRLDRSTKTQTEIARVTEDVLPFRFEKCGTGAVTRKYNTSPIPRAISVCVL